MRALMGRRIARLCAVAAAAVLGASTVATPAQADHANRDAYSTSFVDGAGALTDDFGEHENEIGFLCVGCSYSWNTDLVIMWQMILVAEGLISAFDVDGKFGTQTHNATRAWQRRYGLADDGIVGRQTWGKADDKLSWSAGRVYYRVGFERYLSFCRGKCGTTGSEGAYQLLIARNGNVDAVNVFSDSHRIYMTHRTLNIHPFNF